MSLNCIPISSTPWGVKIDIVGLPPVMSSSSISISRSSRLPPRNIARSFSRVGGRRLGRWRPARRIGSEAILRRSQPEPGAGAGGRRAGAPPRALFGSRPNRLFLLLEHQGHRGIDEIPDDRLDIATHVANLGELRGFDLDERRLGELGETARHLGLADARGSDHDDVLRGDLVAQLFRDLLSPPAISQRNRHRALGFVLPDDVPVEFGDNLPGRKRLKLHGSVTTLMLSLV